MFTWLLEAFNKYDYYSYNPFYSKMYYLWDQNNNKYLDFASGIAVSNLGHCHPTLENTKCDQKTLASIKR